MFLYLLGLLPLTHLIVNLRPTMNTTATGEHRITMKPISFIEVLVVVVISIKEDLCLHMWNFSTVFQQSVCMKYNV